MCEEAPRMDLQPPVRLSQGERQRLKRYSADVLARYCAVSQSALAASQARPLHLSVLRPAPLLAQPCR